jgi:hypothetical protein
MMASWEKKVNERQKTLGPCSLTEERPGFIFKRAAQFTEHTRNNKAYPDAEALLHIEAGGCSDIITLSLEEEFEMSNRNIRSNSISVSLSRKNIDALRAILDKHDAERSHWATGQYVA